MTAAEANVMAKFAVQDVVTAGVVELVRGAAVAGNFSIQIPTITAETRTYLLANLFILEDTADTTKISW